MGVGVGLGVGVGVAQIQFNVAVQAAFLHLPAEQIKFDGQLLLVVQVLLH